MKKIISTQFNKLSVAELVQLYTMKLDPTKKPRTRETSDFLEAGLRGIEIGPSRVTSHVKGANDLLITTVRNIPLPELVETLSKDPEGIEKMLIHIFFGQKDEPTLLNKVKSIFQNIVLTSQTDELEDSLPLIQKEERNGKTNSPEKRMTTLLNEIPDLVETCLKETQNRVLQPLEIVETPDQNKENTAILLLNHAVVYTCLLYKLTAQLILKNQKEPNSQTHPKTMTEFFMNETMKTTQDTQTEEEFRKFFLIQMTQGGVPNSSLALRVSKSATTDPISGTNRAMLSAFQSMLGDSHGGASTAALEFFNEIVTIFNQLKSRDTKSKKTDNELMKDSIKSKLTEMNIKTGKATIFGYGHGVMKTGDFRIEVLKEVRQSRAQDPRIELFKNTVEEAFREWKQEDYNKRRVNKSIPPLNGNMDGETAFIMETFGINSKEKFPLVFFIARAAQLLAIGIEANMSDFPLLRPNNSTSS